jgi:hypothetical protein
MLGDFFWLRNDFAWPADIYALDRAAHRHFSGRLDDVDGRSALAMDKPALAGRWKKEEPSLNKVYRLM